MSLLKSILKSFNQSKNLEQNIEVNNDIKKLDSINLSSLVVYAPKTIFDVNKVIDCVSNGRSVIINFASIKKTNYQTTIDYLSGALYAIKATISRLQNQLYVIMPKSVKLATL